MNPRIFEQFPTETVCPVCGTSDEGQCLLVPIQGTEEDGICEAKPIHLRCLVAWTSMSFLRHG